MLCSFSVDCVFVSELESGRRGNGVQEVHFTRRETPLEKVQANNFTTDVDFLHFHFGTGASIVSKGDT